MKEQLVKVKGVEIHRPMTSIPRLVPGDKPMWIITQRPGPAVLRRQFTLAPQLGGNDFTQVQRED